MIIHSCPKLIRSTVLHFKLGKLISESVIFNSHGLSRAYNWLGSGTERSRIFQLFAFENCPKSLNHSIIVNSRYIHWVLLNFKFHSCRKLCLFCCSIIRLSSAQFILVKNACHAIILRWIYSVFRSSLFHTSFANVVSIWVVWVESENHKNQSNGLAQSQVTLVG